MKITPSAYRCGSFLFLLVLLLQHDCYGQKQGQARIDSLLSVLPTLKEDTNKVQVLCRLSYLYAPTNADNGLRYAEQSIALAQKLNYQQGVGDACNNMGINYSYKSDLDKTIDCWIKALKAYELAGSRLGKLRIIGNLGNIYLMQGDYSSALENDLNALKLAEELNDKRSIEINLGNIGAIYEYTKNFDKALEYYSAAMKLSREAGDKTRIASNLVNIGNVFLDLSKYDSALLYDNEALNIYEQLGNTEGVGRTLDNIASVYRLKKNLKTALEYDSRALKVFEGMQFPYGIARVEMTMGVIYLDAAKDTTHQGHLTPLPLTPGELNTLNRGNTYLSKNDLLRLSSQHFERAVKLNRELQNLDDLQTCYLYLSETRSLLGEFNAAYEIHKLYTRLKDSVFSTANKLKISNLETKREIQLKDKQIELDKLALEKKRNERGFFVAGMALLLVIIIIVFRYYRAQRVLNKMLYDEKQKVEQTTIELKEANDELNVTLDNLKSTQEQLIETEKQKENEVIRSRISQDIHDDISSELTRISWISALAKIKAGKNDTAEVTTLLDKISGYSQGTVAKLGEIIWAVNPRNDTLESLLAYMRNYVARFLADTSFKYTISFPEENTDIMINPELRRNLFLVLKESLNNAVKYSMATEIKVSCIIDNGHYTFHIADNGKGIDADLVQGSGNGMGNMRMRMETVKGTFEVNSATGGGTTIVASGLLF